jgi:hypothetical protein
VLLILLVTFTFVAGSGFWRTLSNLTYIYFFPFVLLAYLVYGSFRIALFTGRSLTSKPKEAGRESKQGISRLPSTLTLSAPVSERGDVGMGKKVLATLRVLARPFHKFTFLWCLLLILSTHKQIIWLALGVLLLHMARTVYRVVKFSVFSKSWLVKIDDGIRTVINTTLDKLALINFETAPVAELKNLWNQLRAFEAAVRFIENSSAFSRWTWLACGAVLLSIYGYLAFLFSFAYFGMARVAGTPLSWPNAFVTSLFIPFYVGDLPKAFGLRLLGGIHCSLVVTVGVGTIVNYFRQRIESLRSVATLVTVRLSAEDTRERYLILQKKVEITPQDDAPNPK